MKFICLGYADETQFQKLSKEELEAAMEECFAYDDELRRGGHFAGGEALQSHKNAITLRHRGGKVEVGDGPFAETIEQLGGILFLEAKDLNQAIALMSKHPGVKFGPFEKRKCVLSGLPNAESSRRISQTALSKARHDIARVGMIQLGRFAL